MNVYIYILKIPVSLQILFLVNLNFIEQFDFLEIFCYFGGINLSEKCVNVRNADMRRDPCYDQLGVRWYLWRNQPLGKVFYRAARPALVRYPRCTISYKSTCTLYLNTLVAHCTIHTIIIILLTNAIYLLVHSQIR